MKYLIIRVIFICTKCTQHKSMVKLSPSLRCHHCNDNFWIRIAVFNNGERSIGDFTKIVNKVIYWNRDNKIEYFKKSTQFWFWRPRQQVHSSIWMQPAIQTKPTWCCIAPFGCFGPTNIENYWSDMFEIPGSFRGKISYRLVPFVEHKYWTFTLKFWIGCQIQW